MGRWKYELKCGKRLRGAIRGGEPREVIEILNEAYEELLEHKVIDDDDYASYTADFDLYGDELDEFDVDYELGEFYDLCDNLGIWIPLF